MKKFLTTIAICLAFFGVTATAWGQFLSGQTPILTQAQSYPSITATGQSNVKRLPDTVQVVVSLQTKGKTTEEAFANLQVGQKAALDKLKTIGIEPECVQFHDFSVDRSQADQRRQMEVIIAQRTSSTAKKKTVVEESVELKCAILIEQPLTGKTAEEILKESLVLKQKIMSADVAPKKAMTPEEEEIAEEMAGMGMSSSSYGRAFGEEQIPDGEPRLVYVANLPEEEYQKALSVAFAQARQQAEFLIKAAGANRLGALMQCSGNISRKSNDFIYYSSNQDAFFSQLTQFDVAKPLRAAATHPDSIEVSISVHTVFKMVY